MLRKASLALTSWAMIACAAAAGPVEDLSAALGMPKLFAILAQEGQAYGKDLDSEMFAGTGGGAWARRVAELHDPTRLERESTERLSVALAGKEEAIAAMIRFLDSPAGQRIVAMELAAREALLDDDTRDAAREAHRQMETRDSPRMDQISRLIEANDLLEQNVAGALNANLAFYTGMVEGGAADPALSRSEMMADLWSQEPQIRSDTAEWLSAYTALAYGPLSSAELEAYITFSRSPEGQIMNQALFASFGAMFDRIALSLGLTAAGVLAGQDI